jgi:energy-coupling factor transport system permease protein
VPQNKKHQFPHPVSLLLGSVAFLGLLIIVQRPWGLFYLAAGFVFALLLLNFKLCPLVRGVWRIWPFLAFTFVLHAVLSSQFAKDRVGTAVFHVTPDGLWLAAFFTIRLALIFSISVALFQSYPPQRYGREVGRLLSRIPFSQSVFAKIELIITLALRFLPFIEQEHHRLTLALASRGQTYTRSISGRLLTLRKVIYPLLLNAFRRADHVALALEARGYDPSVRQTSLIMKSPSNVEISATILTIALLLPALWL